MGGGRPASSEEGLPYELRSLRPTLQPHPPPPVQQIALADPQLLGPLLWTPAFSLLLNQYNNRSQYLANSKL